MLIRLRARGGHSGSNRNRGDALVPAGPEIEGERGDSHVGHRPGDESGRGKK